MNNGISVKGVNYTFGENNTAKQVLFDCNLDLESGEVVILTGPSGSGKTTLLTLIGALRTLQDGCIYSMGRELGVMSSSQMSWVRRGIGFIFQDHNLFDALKASETIRLAMELDTKNTPRKEFKSILISLFHEIFSFRKDSINEKLIVDLLTRLGLQDHKNSLPSELSTGQKQRVAIARALINNPAIILADEPTASLDKVSGLNVMSLLREHAVQHGAIVLIVSHDHRLFPYADRVVRMEDGTIIADQETT